MSTIRVFFLANLLALATTVTAQAQSQPRFQCWGSYTNIFQAPQSGDPSGIEVFILSRSEVFVVVGEGHVIGTKAIANIGNAELNGYVTWRRDYYSDLSDEELPKNAKRNPTDKTLQWEIMLGKAMIKWAHEKGYRGTQALPTFTFVPKKKRVMHSNDRIDRKPDLKIS